MSAFLSAAFDLAVVTAIVLAVFFMLCGAYLIAVSFAAWLGFGRNRK